MKILQCLRKSATTVSGAGLLLALASSAFAAGGGKTPATNLQGVTITGTTVGTSYVYTVSLATGATFDYVGGTGTIDKIGGFFIFSSPQVTTTGSAPLSAPPTFSADTLTNGATGYGFNGYNSINKPILPGSSGAFSFNTAAPAGATFLLDIYQNSAGSPFGNTGKISFALLPSPSAVPEPSSVATLAVGSLGLMGMVLSARKRRRANDMI